MSFVYFHKRTGQFQFVLNERDEFDWNDCFEVVDASVGDVYELVDGQPVLVRHEDENPLILQHFKQNQYKNNRAGEYPPITDYIDGVVKGDQAQIQAYIDACLAVKAKYPKGA